MYIFPSELQTRQSSPSIVLLMKNENRSNKRCHKTKVFVKFEVWANGEIRLTKITDQAWATKSHSSKTDPSCLIVLNSTKTEYKEYFAE